MFFGVAVLAILWYCFEPWFHAPKGSNLDEAIAMEEKKKAKKRKSSM